jgi:hypothetical protein
MRHDARTGLAGERAESVEQVGIVEADCHAA